MKIDKESIRESYNKIAKDYSLHRDSFDNSELLNRLIAILPPNSLILDLGCGSGDPIDIKLVDAGHQVIGIDISDEQIDLAKKKLPEQKFYRRDFEELEMDEFLVDAIVSFYAIYHISREAQGLLFKKMFSYLKSGGAILLTLSAKEWEGEKEDFYGASMTWSQNSPEINRDLIEKAGFRIIYDEIDTAGNERHQAILAIKD